MSNTTASSANINANALNPNQYNRINYSISLLILLGILLIWSNLNISISFRLDSDSDLSTISYYKHKDATTTSDQDNSAINQLPPGLAYKPNLKFNTRPDAWDDVAIADLVQEWGQWLLVDTRLENRPKNDFFVGESIRNRDLNAKDFPSNAWQRDGEYLNRFIKEGLDLVHRVKRAILAEYGFHKYNGDHATIEDEALKKAFGITFVDFSKGEQPPKFNHRKREGMPGAGWMSIEAMDNLSRRILHAMMTNDEFTIVLGGHSSAAGHGNHFSQSYMMQLHHVLEPVFHRLGIKLVTRNNAQGGLGTIQTAMGSKDIYGSEIDVMIWDSHMTEGDDMSIDFFTHQALLGSNRTPFLWGGNWYVKNFGNALIAL